MKPKITLLLLLLSAAAFAQSGALSIDGREWADANVAAPGSFAARPDVYTEFYSWSSLTPLPATGASVAGFSYIKSVPAAWTVNPCPAEYRLPTAEELAKLNASGSSNAAAGERGNAVAGRFYGPNHATASLPNNMAGAIFLPMGGGRSGVSGKLIDQDLAGYYWSSTAAVGNNGTALVFNNTWKAWGALQTRYSRSVGMNLRCVRGSIAVTGVSLSQATATLSIGGTVTLTATVQPVNATNQTVAWSSNNPAVATVTNGVVTAVAAGTATITVTTADGGKTATCDVTVAPATISVTGVTLSQTAANLNVGGTVTLTATVQPTNATNQAVAWSSNNSAVATVTDGVVTAIAAGTATITVTTADGSKAATCTITVSVPVTGVTLSQTTATVNVGSKLTLTATVQPSTATNKTVSWKSSKTTVATVANGVVTAVAAGTATITVTTADGSKTATCAITVRVPVTGVTLSQTTATVNVGSKLTLTATVQPTTATNKTVAWKSSKTTVATVANGVVTAVAAGTATITVTTADGSKTATCAITVKVPDPTSTLTLNGVVWAPVNVGATVGSWASRPDSHGAMFQFNRSKAWSPTSPAAGVAISGWTASIDEDRSWNESTNAVCPTGWRLPTEAELQDLYSSSRAADVINSGTWADKGTKGAAVAGKFYGPRHASCSLPSNMSNCIFLPASGNRAGADGALVSQGTHGTYSSSTQNNTRNRVVMNFTATSSSIMRTYLKTHAYSVRCVKK